MTVRMSHLSIDHDADAWAFDAPGADITEDETYRFDLLSVVRHILRERSDCDIIPVVRAAVYFGEVNEWGHNGEVEVTYSKRGYRAIYGVHFGATVTHVQCYMD